MLTKEVEIYSVGLVVKLMNGGRYYCKQESDMVIFECLSETIFTVQKMSWRQVRLKTIGSHLSIHADKK